MSQLHYVIILMSVIVFVRHVASVAMENIKGSSRGDASRGRFPAATLWGRLGERKLGD